MALISVFRIGSFSLKLFNINGVLYHSKHCLQDNNMLDVDAGIFNSLKEMSL